ncbi:hypothetical protein AVEN_60596-1 [Araneus ventricosus]|uniref:Uncharacterized protein n=1 Tax=Araneus ventricosus TaxID=182803 RepID=A0A4Y2F0H1_ARAVE|nr:hypothetical protein AVEN_60596-1 [Araneus ventricosus]
MYVLGQSITSSQLIMTNHHYQRHKSNQNELETSLKRRRLLQDAVLKGPTSSSDNTEDTEDSTPEYDDDDYFDGPHRKRPLKPSHPPSTPATVVQEITISTKEEEEGEKSSKGLDSTPSQSEPTRPRGHNRKPKLPASKAAEEGAAKTGEESRQKTKAVEEHHGKSPPGEEEVGNHQAVPATTARPRKDPTSPNVWHKLETKGQIPPRLVSTSTGKSNVSEPTATPIEEDCTPPGKFLILS